MTAAQLPVMPNEPGAEPSSSEAPAINPCTLCAPLGAVLVTCGVRGAISLLHGGQGCATYIRRYLISHFREPVDVASSSFGETQTVFGGEDNLIRALENIERQYSPEIVAVATTCVAETVGEDVPLLLKKFNSRREVALPVVFASTPSYRDGHIEGFHAMVHSLVDAFAAPVAEHSRVVNLLPPLLSPADLRHLREVIQGFGVSATILPDFSETLDGAIRQEYRALPPGGTPIEAIAQMAGSLETIDLTMTGKASRASDLLAKRGTPTKTLGLPIGVRATDALVEVLEQATSERQPQWMTDERGRLLDAYADGHKYVFGKRVCLYGDPEWVVALAGFLLEIGACPVVCATGARNHALEEGLRRYPEGSIDEVLQDVDFSRIEQACRRQSVELLIGNSKGYSIARNLDIPLVRVGFPVHDRIGAGRLQVLGYRGTLVLFDSIVNTLLALQQDTSRVGYSYL